MARQMEKWAEGLTGCIFKTILGTSRGLKSTDHLKCSNTSIHMLSVKPLGNIRLNNPMSFRNTKKSYILDTELFRMP